MSLYDFYTKFTTSIGPVIINESSYKNSGDSYLECSSFLKLFNFAAFLGPRDRFQAD